VRSDGRSAPRRLVLLDERDDPVRGAAVGKAAALDRVEAVALLHHDRGRLDIGGRDHYVVELEHQTTSKRTIAARSSRLIPILSSVRISYVQAFDATRAGA
jgi:hypothetical protein